MVRPASRGRQKIAMKKIEDKTNLGVTFTKRRNGLFKKANELVSLCGAELAILMFSPGNKAYSYGHPNVYTILDRFLGHLKKPKVVDKYMEEYEKAKIESLHSQLEEIEKLVEAEKRISKELKEGVIEGNSIAMMPRDQLTYPQMLELCGMMKRLQLRISSAIQQRDVNRNIINIDAKNMAEQEGFLFSNFGQIFRSSNNLGLNLGS